MGKLGKGVSARLVQELLAREDVRLELKKIHKVILDNLEEFNRYAKQSENARRRHASDEEQEWNEKGDSLYAPVIASLTEIIRGRLDKERLEYDEGDLRKIRLTLTLASYHGEAS